ncbi:MAG: SUMF1/EgtB/PvdO family nonheme iron enzyme [Chloroflexi bacterium]|nr:SUMF1/EgtB/PvdO family nonheme iron enzyme [Chloroflexota bacterium]
MNDPSENLPDELLDELMTIGDRGLLSERQELIARWPKFKAEIVAFLDGGDQFYRLLDGVDAPGDTQDELPERIGPYKVEKLLGKGGMGSVYLATESGDVDIQVALKVINPSLATTEFQERFIGEMRALSLLAHESIVQVYSGGKDEDGRSYIAMEFVSGKPITAYCAGKELNLEDRLSLFMQVCAGVHYAHQRGVMHRDIKPDNILVRDGEHGPIVKLIDFGLARLINDDLNQNLRAEKGGGRRFSGTVEYASPEQFWGREQSLQSDIYSLGAVFYEIVSGVVPVSADSLFSQKFFGEKASPIEAPRHLCRGGRAMPRELDWVILKALAGDPEERYDTPKALAEDLSRIQTGHPVSAGPQTKRYTLSKWVGRNREVWLTTAITLIGLSGAVFLWDLVVRGETEIEGLTDEIRRQEPLVALANMVDMEAFINPSIVHGPESIPSARSYTMRLEQWVQESREVYSKVGKWFVEKEKDKRYGEVPEELISEKDLGPYAVEAQWLRKNILDVQEERDGMNRQDLSQDEWVAYSKQIDDDMSEWRAGIRELLGPQGGLEAVPTQLDEGHVYALEQIGSIVTELFRPGLSKGGLVAQESNQKRAERILSQMKECKKSGDWGRQWGIALESINDVAKFPHYRGVKLERCAEMIPIRANAAGLWEFAYLPSGRVPNPKIEGDGYLMEKDSAIVLVLLPGGDADIGVSANAGDKRYDPWSKPETGEGPVVPVKLDPFFISKYETTQAQWELWMRQNPSNFSMRNQLMGVDINGSHPVEGVSWEDAQVFVWSIGLALPTSAQWEYACRAGTDNVWSHGSLESDLEGCANLFDEAYVNSDAPRLPYAGKEADWDDGYPLHSPVGAFKQNGFGLYDMHGNVWEYCLDPYNFDLNVRHAVGDGLGLPWASPSKVARGGSFAAPAWAARVGRRISVTPRASTTQFGFRAARPLSWNH